MKNDKQFMRVFRFTIANIDADTLLRKLAEARINATTWDTGGVYFDETDGFIQREKGATFESAAPGFTVLDFVTALLRELGEDSAYFTVDGKSPQIVKGKLQDLGGFYDVQALTGTR